MYPIRLNVGPFEREGFGLTEAREQQKLEERCMYRVIQRLDRFSPLGEVFNDTTIGLLFVPPSTSRSRRDADATNPSGANRTVDACQSYESQISIEAARDRRPGQWPIPGLRSEPPSLPHVTSPAPAPKLSRAPLLQK